MLATQAKRNLAAEALAQKKRDHAERLLREADLIERKGRAYVEQSDEEILARLNRWDSYLRRTARDARNLGKWHTTDMYEQAMKLYRFLVRQCRHEAKAIKFERLCKLMGAKHRHVDMLLKLLKGEAVQIRYHVQKKSVLKTLPGFPPNDSGLPLITVKNGGSRPNVYAVAPPPHFEFIWEAEDAGLLAR